MEVQILSNENVKPSSPTPSHLRTFKLSLLDHLIPVPYAPIILFYPITHHFSIQLLKQSLSETLTHFYPLAGKIKDDLSIDCNDQGAYFVEARVNSHLSEFLSQPDLLLLHKFLSCESIINESTAFVTNVQVNFLDCGGTAIGICILHRILDGVALSAFLKAWSATARGSSHAIVPSFVAPSLFPATDVWLRDAANAMWGSAFKKGKCETRRFVFYASAIATLKAQSTSSIAQNLTRVEVVSGLIWKCAMAASKENKCSLVTHLVNLRRRIVPSLSNCTIGNLLWIESAELRKGISRIDGDFIEAMRGSEGKAVMGEYMKEIGEKCSREKFNHFGFSSWCKFGFYEVDFGWGKPIWVSCNPFRDSVFMNLILLIDTRSGDGIEAWVCLDEQDMALLVSNSELLSFASLDPSPLL